MTKPERVLVLCTGNSCRSQMAEGWLRALYPDRVEPFSAGSAPAERVHPLAVRVMAEVGIDLSGAKPKHLIEFVGQTFDKVLTTCDSANEACPIFPGRAQRFHHDFFDPAHAEGSPEERLALFRHVRDEIKYWLVDIIDGHAPPTAGQPLGDPIDQVIRGAMDQGKFDHLAGQGKPFPKDDNPWEDRERWAANRILKSGGFSLPWVEERRDIEEQIITARASLIRSWRYRRDRPAGPLSDEGWRKAQTVFRERGADINKQIRTYNLKVPMVELHMLVIDVEREIRQVVDS